MRKHLTWTSALAVLAALVVGAPAQAAPTCAPATVSITGTDAYEGSPLAFQITATATTPGCVPVGQVGYQTKVGTATPGSDYTGVSGSVEWKAGSQQTRTVVVPVVADSNAEADEYFTVVLSGAVGLQVTTGSGVGTILDDDGKADTRLVLTIQGGGICWHPDDLCAIPLKLSTIARASVSVRWATRDLDAVAGVDYADVKSATVVFEKGTDTAYAVVDLLDGGSAGPVQFAALFSQPSAGSVAEPKVPVTIGWR